jgi:hypothetical protein
MLTFFWLFVSVVLCINIDLIRQKEGANSALFGMTFFMIVFSFYCLAVYAYDVFQYEEGMEVTYEAPVPFHETMMILVSLLLIVMSSWSIYNYGKKYEDDDSIPPWKKKLFKWSNVTLLILACLELGLRRGHQQAMTLHAAASTWLQERQKKKEDLNALKLTQTLPVAPTESALSDKEAVVV